MQARRGDARSTTTTGAPPADPSTRDALDVARDLGVDPAVGLSATEAAYRLSSYGPNELRAKPPTPPWRRILAQLRNPLIYLLLAAAAISTVSWAVEGATGVPIEALVIAAVIVANAAIGFIQEDRAQRAVAALQAVTAARSTVLRDGRLQTVPSQDLVRGDVVALTEGDSVGADGRVLTASELRIAEAQLTGESEPVTKDAGTLPATALLGDRTNMVYRGTAVVQGVGRAVITGTGMETETGAIADMLDTADVRRSPLQKEIDWIGRVLGTSVIAIAVLVIVVTALVNDVTTLSGFVTVLLLGVALAVAAVPEGLPAIVSVVLALGMQRMAQRHAVVKKLPSVETLGSTTVIASDKTGTLSKNEMTIRCVRTASGEVLLTGVGYRPHGTALDDGRPPTGALALEIRLVAAGGSLANDAQLDHRDGDWEIQGDPTEAAFLVAAPKVDGAVDLADRFTRVSELPFTSERKMMSVVIEEKAHGTRYLVAKGAPDVLLSRCTSRQVGERVAPLDDAGRARVSADVEELSARALRPLAVAYRRLDPTAAPRPDADDEHGLTYVGTVGMIDPPRDEVSDAIRQAQRGGLRVVMVTGDHPTTAKRIAEDLGILRPGDRLTTGAALDGLSPAQLADVTAETSVYARVAPKHKLDIVRALQARAQVVAVTGDGVNDAPALRTADIGVAMGTGTEVTKEAADMILGDDNFATIVAAIRQGRVIFDNIRKFLRYLLSSNIGEVFTVFFGTVLAGVIGLAGASGEEVVVPLLATQILWINLVTDAAPALAMGADPEIEDVMSRPPRRASDRIIDGSMWTGIISVGLVMAAVTLLTMDIFLPGGLVHGSDSLDVARTGAFTTLVFAQLFNAFNSRSATSSAFRQLFANSWLWAAVAVGTVLQVAVVQLPVLQTAFGTTSLNGTQWAATIAMASAVLWFEEGRKVLLRALAARRDPPLHDPISAGQRAHT